MVNKRFGFGILVMMLVFGMTVVGCVTTSSIGGTVDSHGLFTYPITERNGDKIASYYVVFGLADKGYEAYADAVRRALDEGKVVYSETAQFLGILTYIVAYAR